MDEVWVPKLLEYKPELLIVSAGFDAHREEDQAQLLMVERDYAFLGRRFSWILEEIPGMPRNCRSSGRRLQHFVFGAKLRGLHYAVCIDGKIN